MFAVQRQEDIGVHPAKALQLQHLPADGDLSAQHRELGVLPGDRGIGANSLGHKHFHRLGHLLGDDRDGVRCTVGRLGDDAGFLTGDPGDVLAEVFGVMTATGASITLVASQRPPIPTSTTATSTGASANAANAIAVSTSNLLIAGPPAASDCASIICTNGSISR